MSQLPKIVKLPKEESNRVFPVKHLSHSSIMLFLTNPFMFKVKYINGDRIESTLGASAVLGNAFHHAMCVFYGGSDEHVVDDQDAFSVGLAQGTKYIEEYNEGWIDFNTSIKDKEAMYKKLAFMYKSYFSDHDDSDEETIDLEVEANEQINVELNNGDILNLPVPLKGYMDKVYRSKKTGKLVLLDYKTSSRFSDPDAIDGRKILQAVIYYFLAYQKYGEKPHSCIFREVKHTENREKVDKKTGELNLQVKDYEFVYEEQPLMFQFFFRAYQDVLEAMMGKQVYPPNVSAMFDSEVSLIAYIHRLDVTEELAKQLKENQVENITDLLTKKVAQQKDINTIMNTVAKKMKIYKPIDYSNMNTQEKIKNKLMQFGVVIDYVSESVGNTVTQYQFAPSIGLRMDRLKTYTSDIEQVLGVSGIQIQAPVPGTHFIGINVPNKERSYVELPSPSGDFKMNLGMTVTGEVFQRDIREMPHLLIAGATGAGKSVFMNSLIEQTLALKGTEIYLLDPKRVELKKYAASAKKHVMTHDQIVNTLLYLTKEMESRYKKFEEKTVRNIEEYNNQGGRMKYSYIFFDEYGDLMTSEYRSDVERLVLRLVQMARAAGIHLVLATQRPSTNVISGTIKANFPAKAAFRMAKGVDSQVLLDELGAETLLGKGDMIFSDDTGMHRLQGFNV